MGFLSLGVRGRFLANSCFLCKDVEETVEHLLVHCHIVRMLWELVLFKAGKI